MTSEILGKELQEVLRIIEGAVSGDSGGSTDLGKRVLDVGFEMPVEILLKMVEAAEQLLRPTPPFAGSFIVVSGIDKAGKGTHCFNAEMLDGVTSIYDFLADSGKRVHTISLPSYNTILGSIVGGYLKRKSGRVIKGEISKQYAWILWSLDRAQHNSLVADWLREDRCSVVLSNRWVESNVVYHQAIGVDKQRILRFERNIIKQTHTIVLDISASKVDGRFMSLDEAKDIYEDAPFLEKVRSMYLRLPELYPFGETYLIDSSRPPEIVSKDIINLLSDIRI